MVLQRLWLQLLMVTLMLYTHYYRMMLLLILKTKYVHYAIISHIILYFTLPILMYTQNGATALMMATATGNIEIVQVLLQHKGDVNIQDAVST